MYGRQELHEEPGSGTADYLWLLAQRQDDRRQPVSTMTHTDLRRQLFMQLVGNPDTEWTARALAASLDCIAPEDSAVDHDRTQEIGRDLRFLMADQWVEPVPFQTLLTVRLTAIGFAQLSQLLDRWSSEAPADERDA